MNILSYVYEDYKKMPLWEKIASICMLSILAFCLALSLIVTISILSKAK